MNYAAMAFGAYSPFLHLNFVILSVSCTSAVCRSGSFVRSMTSSLKETVSIACPTVLLFRVHRRACALLELISDSVPWYHCDSFFLLLLDSGDCCEGVNGCFVAQSSQAHAHGLIKPLLFRSANPFV